MDAHKITYFPVGSGDTMLISLNGNKFHMLVDYAHRNTGKDDKRHIDLKTELKKILDDLGVEALDVVVFTHLDADHVEGCEDFFYFEHASKYQGEKRIKIKELWVPAAAIIETSMTGKSIMSARVIRQEARYRTKKLSGIRIFSGPNMLNDWAENEGLDKFKVQTLITDAGHFVNNSNMKANGLNVFAHSPFATTVNGTKECERNRDCIAMNLQLNIGKETKYKIMLWGDLKKGEIEKIYEVTKYYNNLENLKYDMMKTPHHSSYTALDADKVNIPKNLSENIKNTFYEQANKGAYIISSSYASSDENGNNPPHQEALDYYASIVADKKGKFYITNAYPNTENPEPLVFILSENGAEPETRDLSRKSRATALMPRAG